MVEECQVDGLVGCSRRVFVVPVYRIWLWIAGMAEVYREIRRLERKATRMENRVPVCYGRWYRTCISIITYDLGNSDGFYTSSNSHMGPNGCTREIKIK